ncbi:MAG: sulfotransferase [Candidatus Peribacteraceae bacterium]|nr:sulfotransferase [Candidatus Peribacteraceae bacterium]
MPYPDFLIIGAQKSGTTWLSVNLRHHPQVHMPAVKELHYFNIIEERVPTSLFARLFDKRNWRWRYFLRMHTRLDLKYKNIRRKYRCLFGRMNDEWYASRFRPKSNQIAGEATPEYAALNLETIMHIKKIMPDLKIIYLLRNPVDRAWSSVFTMFKVWGKSVDPLDEDELMSYLEGSFQRSLGAYIQSLDRWMQVFPEERFFIDFFEKITLDPDDLLMSIFNFLGIRVDSKHIHTHLSRQVIMSGPGIEMPKKIRKYLSQMYLEDLEHLHKRFGGFATQWLKQAQKCLGHPLPASPKNTPELRDEAVACP